MRVRILSVLLVTGLALAGCTTPYKKRDIEERKVEEGKKIPDQSSDSSFQGFVGRLRIAANKKDRVTLSGMITNDFGYRWDPAPAGETPFDYWDQHNVWPELQNILKQKFVQHELYMVAPPEVATDPGYAGYRAGLRIVNGSWKFAYFVPPEEAGQ